MSYSFIEQSKRDGSLVLFQLYLRGNQNFLDLSGQGNDAAAISNAWWGGGGVQFAPVNGYIQVADAAELQLTRGSFCVLGAWDRLEQTTTRIFAKRDAGGTNYELQIDAVPSLRFFDGVNSRQIAVDYRGSRSIAGTFGDGLNWQLYLDGLSAGLSGNASAVSVDDADLYIGNNYLAASAVASPVWAVCLFNDILTATEMAVCHGELMDLAGGSH